MGATEQTDPADHYRIEDKKFKAGDCAVKLWFLWSLIWFPIFATLGFILAIKFFQPYFLGDAAYLTFGRLRPAHVKGCCSDLSHQV